MPFFQGTLTHTSGAVYIARREELIKIVNESHMTKADFAKKYLKHKHAGYLRDMLAGRRTISERIILLAREAARGNEAV